MSNIDEIAEDKYLAVSRFNVNGSNKLVHRDSQRAPRQKFTIANISPNNVPGNAFQSAGSFATFDISTDHIHVPDQFTLKMDITNTDGTNTYTAMPAPYLISYIEVRIDSSVVETIYSDDLYKETLLMYNQEELEVRGPSMNIDPATYDANGAIATSGSVSYYLPFRNCLSKSLFMPAVTNKVRLFVYFRNGPQEAGDGLASALQLDNLTLYLSGVRYSDVIANRLLNRYKASPHVVRSLVRRDGSVQVSNVETTKFKQSLDSLTGKFAFFNLMLIDQASTGSARYTPLEFSDITLLTSAGVPVNVQDLPETLLRNIFPSELLLGQGSSVKRVINYPLCDNPELTFCRRIASGYEQMNGKYNLQITPNLGASTNVNVSITAYQYCQIETTTNGTVVVSYL